MAPLVEALPYFELAGHRLERSNYGAPQCLGIKVNPKNASRTEPQAWSVERDGKTHWLYNWSGAMAEAKHLGKRLPTIDEWMTMLGSVSGDAAAKAQALGIPLAGYRNAGGGVLFDVGRYADLWSSSPDGDVHAQYAYL